jgi:hypothetical protein
MAKLWAVSGQERPIARGDQGVHWYGAALNLATLRGEIVIIVVWVRKIILAFIVISLSSCAVFVGLDPDLDACKGKKLGDLQYPPTKINLGSHIEGNLMISEYSLDSLLRCRWVFYIDRDSQIVLDWKYSDAKAKHACQLLPAHGRP